MMYGDDGNLLSKGASRVKLDLTSGSAVRILAGPLSGTVAHVEGRDEEGHYQLRLPGTMPAGDLLLLGLWWVEAAVLGTTPSIPVSSVV